MCDVDSCIMRGLMKKIPMDIIREHIAPYMYLKQPECLLRDIESYVDVRERLIDLYSSMYPNMNKYDDWLSNDICRFFNENVPINHGYTNNNLRKWRRLFVFHDKSDHVIIDYLTRYFLRYSSREFRVYLGILTPFEREEFIEFCITI